MTTTRPLSPSALFEDSIQKRHKISDQDSLTTTHPPPSSSSSKQVCVVMRRFELIPEHPGLKESIYFYLLDPDKKDDSSSLHPRNSILQFAGNYPRYMALLVVDSTLYMFGGLSLGIGWQRASYSFNLPPHPRMDSTSYPRTLDFDCKQASGIRTLPPMAFPAKSEPRAVFVGGKICVFSFCTDSGQLRFELYDLASGQWLTVPEPRFTFNEREGVCEVTFYAVEDNWLYICTTAGSFRIDCDRRELQWETIEVLPPCCDGWYGDYGPIVKIGNLLLSPSFTAYDMDNTTKAPQYFGFFEHSEGNFYPQDSSILLLPKEDKDRLRACIVELGGLNPDRIVIRGRDAPVLRVSLIKFDYNDDTSLLKPTLLNARLFDLDFDTDTFQISAVGLFQI